MRHPFGVRTLGTAAGLLFALQVASASTLYDPGLNTLPSAQGWSASVPSGATQAVAGGVYTLDTTASNGLKAGSALTGVAALDTSAGFTLDFDLHVVSESHARPERGGFSFIVTGLDAAHAVEIAFWSDHVWAYTGSFDHGADAAFDTATTTHAYSLAVKNNAYVFTADGATLLSGALINLAAGGPVYTQAGLVFFGDDTTSAQSHAELGRVTLAAIPEPATGALLASGLLGLAWLRRVRPAR